MLTPCLIGFGWYRIRECSFGKRRSGHGSFYYLPLSTQHDPKEQLQYQHKANQSLLGGQVAATESVIHSAFHRRAARFLGVLPHSRPVSGTQTAVSTPEPVNGTPGLIQGPTLPTVCGGFAGSLPRGTIYAWFGRNIIISPAIRG